MMDFDYIRQNKSLLIMQKKNILKQADAVSFGPVSVCDTTGMASKAMLTDDDKKSGIIRVKVVINTTNLMDSHDDVHVPGLWKKSLKESPLLYLLQEHKLEFEKIISDEVKAMAATMQWKDMGYKYEGDTQALIFDAAISKDDNEYMYNKYANGKVYNHSVGMRYVNLFLAMNSDSRDDEQERKAWNKYYPIIANKEMADEKGYFFAVTEAKIIEGSAVPLGSNFATPTISVEAGKGTPEQQEPPTPPIVDWKKIAEHIGRK